MPRRQRGRGQGRHARDVRRGPPAAARRSRSRRSSKRCPRTGRSPARSRRSRRTRACASGTTSTSPSPRRPKVGRDRRGGRAPRRDAAARRPGRAGADAAGHARERAGPTTPSSTATPATTTCKPPAARGGRQVAGFDHRFDGLTVAGVPGRPQFRPWPLALARLGAGADRAARAATPTARPSKDLYAAFDAPALRRPVGRRPRPRSGWRRGRDEIARQRLKGSRFDASVAAPAARRPGRDARRRGPLDYDSARQIAWAFQVDLFRLASPSPRTTPGSSRCSPTWTGRSSSTPTPSREPGRALVTSRGLCRRPAPRRAPAVERGRVPHLDRPRGRLRPGRVQRRWRLQRLLESSIGRRHPAR